MLLLLTWALLCGLVKMQLLSLQKVCKECGIQGGKETEGIYKYHLELPPYFFCGGQDITFLISRSLVFASWMPKIKVQYWQLLLR